MRLATFNIYWFGGERGERSPEDERRVERVIGGLDADVIAFQEIMDPDAFERLLARVNDVTGRSYSMRDANDGWLQSNSSRMRVVMAYDTAVVKLINAAPLEDGSPPTNDKSIRKPIALHVRAIATEVELTVVGLHFQSGYPDFDGERDAAVRRGQARSLAAWLTGHADGENPAFPGPTGSVVVMGDFNALNDLDVSAVSFRVERPDVSYDSLEPLRSGDLADWWWPMPAADRGDGSTVYSLGLVVDFVILSPDLVERVAMPPRVVAFDRDPLVGGGPLTSDHRPVVLDLAL